MELVGQILKKNRKLKKFTLVDVCKELKISEEILSNIENNVSQNEINSVFIIGHLRSYCSFLELNQDVYVEQFKKEHLPEVTKSIEIKRPKLQNSILFSNKIFSLSLILIIFVSFYFLFIEVDNSSREYAIIPDLPENSVSIIEKSSIKDLDENKKIKINKVKNFAILETNLSSSSVIASLPNNEYKKPTIITLKFIGDTWVQLRDKNDEIIFSQLMNKNDEFSYTLDKNYSITSGNAGHILVLINQKVRGKIGKRGQVVDSLVLNKNFNN